MLKFLQRQSKQQPAPEPTSGPTDGVSMSTPPAPQTLTPQSPQPDTLDVGSATGSTGPFDALTTADFEPQPGTLGAAAARKALSLIGQSRPRTMFFVSHPRTARHAIHVHALLVEQARSIPLSDALVVTADFADDQRLNVLRLPNEQAVRLATGVSESIEMLSVTIPAAFESDSYKVARLSLDEELRSGHDAAIDALKRRALAQNIGLLRTPLGYAVAPMHEGRVVSPEVFKALPNGLKAEVEAKLNSFENELSGVLENRTTLQQDYRARLRDLDREVASLAVRASLASVQTRFKEAPTVAAFLEALNRDLISNAALFITAGRHARGLARAPVEIALDTTLARYRIQVLGPAGSSSTVERPDGLERADLCGVAHPSQPVGHLKPAGLRAGAITRAGSGVVVIEANELMAQYSAWPLLKQAFRAASILPSDTTSPTGRATGIALPFDARLVVTGDQDDYHAWCTLDRDVARSVRLIKAFDATVPLTKDTEREFARVVSAIIAHAGLNAIEGAGIAVLLQHQTISGPGEPTLSTDLDAVGDIIELAAVQARSNGRQTMAAHDIRSGIEARANLPREDGQPLAASGGAAGVAS